MTQTDLPTIDGTPVTGTSGTDLADYLNDWRDTLYSNHAGASRPSYVVAGMVWIKNVSGTLDEVYYYDGTDDILLASINPTANTVSFTTAYNIYSNPNNAAISLSSTPPDGMAWDRTTNTLTLSKSAGAAMFIGRHGSDGLVAAWFRNNASVGGISVTTTATTYATSSDYRLKYDIEPIVTFDTEAVSAALSGPLGKLMRVRPVKYRMYADDGAAQHYGFIAHELQEEIPHAVTGFKDQTEERSVQIGEVEDAANPGTMLAVTELQQVPVMQGVDHSQIMSLAVAAIQQLTLRVIELEARLNQE